MADVLQGFQLLGRFSLLFPFLFVLVVVYALLSKFKIFGGNAGVNGIIALMVAAMFMFSSRAVTVINLMAPWFVVLFVFIVFILIAFMLFGVQESDFASLIKSSDHGSIVIYWVIALALIIGLGAIASVSDVFSGNTVTTTDASGQTVIGQTAETGSSAFWATLFHPKVLGMIMILLIAMFTLQRLAAYK